MFHCGHSVSHFTLCSRISRPGICPPSLFPAPWVQTSYSWASYVQNSQEALYARRFLVFYRFESYSKVVASLLSCGALYILHYSLNLKEESSTPRLEKPPRAATEILGLAARRDAQKHRAKGVPHQRCWDLRPFERPFDSPPSLSVPSSLSSSATRRRRHDQMVCQPFAPRLGW